MPLQVWSGFCGSRYFAGLLRRAPVPSSGKISPIRYGLPVFGDRFTGTPEIGFGLSDSGRDYSLGLRLTREGRDAGSFEFSLEAERRETANDNAPEHGIGFRLTARW